MGLLHNTHKWPPKLKQLFSSLVFSPRYINYENNFMRLALYHTPT